MTSHQFKREALAGLTSFFAISYIIIVNPLILKDAGIPQNLSVFATIFSSALGSFLMGWLAKAPIILTPGMGINAFFTYTLVVQMHFTWQEAIAASTLSTLAYVVIAMTPLSKKLIEAIPTELKAGITAGIGLFLVVLGLEKAHLITSGENALLQAGNLSSPEALLGLLGLLLTVILYFKKVQGSFILAIGLTSMVGAITKVGLGEPIHVSLTELTKYPEIIAQADFSKIGSLSFLLAVFSMTMTLVFESLGILDGLLGDQAKEKFDAAFKVNAVVAFVSGFLGTSPTVAAAESATGIESGGKTGITSMTTALLFLLSLFAIPLLRYIPEPAIAPVIILTGAMMMSSLESIDLKDFSKWLPAFLIVSLIPLTGSIATGLAFGFISYPIIQLLIGKGKDLSPVLILLGVLFFLQLVVMAVFG